MSNDEILTRMHALLGDYQAHRLTVGELALAADFHISSLTGLDAGAVLGLREHMERLQEADQWAGESGEAHAQRLVVALADFRDALESIGGTTA